MNVVKVALSWVGFPKETANPRTGEKLLERNNGDLGFRVLFCME